MSRTNKPILVFQTDFTYAEGAVSSMYGVVKSVDRELEIFDGTHYIPRFDVWSASYRLYQSLPFWPEGTIYVSVVDPGVGTPRRACVAKTADGHYVVTPDNGALTHLARYVGITEVREIDEAINRNPNTRGTSVFHGRDLFGYCAARFASGIITWEEIGPTYPVDEIVLLPMAEPVVNEGLVTGIVDIIDPNFGNAWTNIPLSVFEEAGISYGDRLHLLVRHGDALVLETDLPLCRTFGEVGKGELLAYTNELMNISFTMNQVSIVEQYGIGFGSDWFVSFKKLKNV
ncbi:MAG: SAM-dependent chlorinase/fluorinase [Coriobacteriales bacterium]|nr:SAM-dependent chlorinase/fluorinase [Coriobacteriales bacterium]